MMASDDIQRRVSKDIFEALLKGTLRKVGDDAYQLTEKGEAEAEKLFKTHAGLEILCQLTLAHVTVSDSDHDALQKTFQMVLMEFEHLERTLGALAAFADYRASIEKNPAAKAVWFEVAQSARTDLREQAANS